MNELCHLFEIELPLIQAPMAGAQGAALAIAVSKAGGLGSLPAAMLNANQLDQALTEISAATDKPFNVNFFCHAAPVEDSTQIASWHAELEPYYREYGVEAAPAAPGRAPFNPEMAGVVCRHPPALVSFHFGLPDESLLEPLRATGARIISSATTVAEAEWLEARGVDAIIAQGIEAGGHRGMFLSNDPVKDAPSQIGTLALVPQIVAAVKLPVIAAGGIADASGVAAVMKLGASGVQVGTSFLCCPEATTSQIHRQALADVDAPSALTNVFSGRPARGIVNRAIRELGPINPQAPAFPLAGSAMQPLRKAAEQLGKGDFTPLWSGQNRSGCKACPAADIVAMLASGFRS
jgi:nitronate monooxygenase